MKLDQIQTSKEAQRARIKWLKEGDNNTKFFHHTTNRRRGKNQISLLGLDGVDISN